MSASNRQVEVLSGQGYRVRTLARKLDVSVWTIYREIKRRGICIIKVGGSYRIPESEVEKILRDSATIADD